MKVVLTQLNVGSKFRFMPSGVSSSLSNYPRDGWLTEAAARKWAKANGHEIVKVEKVAGNGEKIHRIEYTYKDRFGKTKKQTSELVGKDVEPLKKRIVEGLTRNGDKLISFGKITTKDSVDFSLIEKIKEKYHADSWNRIDRESKRKIISHLKTRWRFPDHLINRFIRDFESDLEDLVKEESWEKTVRWIDGRAKKVDINPYSKSYGHSLTVPSYERKQPGVDKLRKPQTNNPKKYRKDSADFDDEPSMLSRVAEKYALDAIGAGVVVPSFKAKTDVFKRLAQGNGPNDYNKAKKGLLDIVETIKKEIERQKSRNIPQKQKDEILKRLNKELEEAKQSIEIYKKGRNIQPQTTKQWNRAMLRKDSVEEIGDAESVEEIREKYTKDASLSQKKDQPVKVTNISIKPSPVGGFEGNVYYSKNGETDLYSPWHIMANGKWGFPFGRSSTRLTPSDKKLIEQKIKKLVSQKGVKVKDSADSVDEIRNKYQSDAVGAGVVNPNFKFQTNVEKRLATTRRGSGRVMTLPQYGKPSKVIVKKDGNSFSVIGKDGQKLNKNTFNSYEEAEKWARGNGWMVERR